MQIYTCSSGNTNQQFTITASTIAWAGKGECLDLTDGNTANGNVVCCSFLLQFFEKDKLTRTAKDPNVDLYG
jgi:hypothetical protein